MKKLLAIFLVVLLFSACSRVTPTQVNETNQPLPQAQEPQIYQIGQNVKIRNLVLTVNSVQPSSGGQILKPDADKQFLNLNLTLKNIGSSKTYINNKNQFILTDGNGNQYQLAITDQIDQNAGSGYLQQTLLPNSQKNLWLGYEVPLSATDFKLNYTPRWSNSVVQIQL